MCAIAGSADKMEVARMLKTMKHRAPDGMRVVDDGKFAVGMGRLAIIDLVSEGLFPYEEDDYVLAYNGEIYNYIELREELKRLGHTFRTNSDTEVLLKSYKQWGAKCLDKLNGMFAFAVYDGKKIFLARDIAGEKPLYIRTMPFAFSSEAKVFRASRLRIDEFFTNFQHCYRSTLYDGVIELPPAHYAIYDFEKDFILMQEWWKFLPRPIYEPSVNEELEWLLEDAVRLRTRSDVPYGLYFSGGVDSTLINSFHEFAEKFTYKGGDQKDFEKSIHKIAWHLDFPVGSFSSYCLWWLAR